MGRHLRRRHFCWRGSERGRARHGWRVGVCCLGIDGEGSLLVCDGGRRLVVRKVSSGSISCKYSAAIDSKLARSIPRQISSCAQRSVDFGEASTRQLDGNGLASLSSRGVWYNEPYINIPVSMRYVVGFHWDFSWLRRWHLVALALAFCGGVVGMVRRHSRHRSTSKEPIPTQRAPCTIANPRPAEN